MLEVTAPGADALQVDLDRAAGQLADLPTTEVAQLVEPAAKAAPRRTGALAASVTVTALADTVTINVGARHGIYVHEGTRHMPARPWVRDAADPDRLAAVYDQHVADSVAPLEGTY